MPCVCWRRTRSALCLLEADLKCPVFVGGGCLLEVPWCCRGACPQIAKASAQGPGSLVGLLLTCRKICLSQNRSVAEESRNNHQIHFGHSTSSLDSSVPELVGPERFAIALVENLIDELRRPTPVPDSVYLFPNRLLHLDGVDIFLHDIGPVPRLTSAVSLSSSTSPCPSIHWRRIV